MSYVNGSSLFCGTPLAQQSAGGKSMLRIRLCIAFLWVLLVALLPAILFAEQEVIIPFGASDYGYRFVHPGSEKGFERLEYENSGFKKGAAGFGANSGSCAINSLAKVQTPWVSQEELLIRKTFVWDSALKNVNLSIAVSGSIQIFVNGHDVSKGILSVPSCPTADSISLNIPEEVLNEGLNLLAVRTRAQSAEYFDLQLTAEVPGATIINYLDTGYRFRFVNPGEGAGFEKVSFNDSKFRKGDAGFGSTGGNCPLNNANAVKTIWPEKKDILLRKFFELGSPDSLRISVAADNSIQVFINGHDVSGGVRTKQSCGRRGDFTFLVPSTFVRKGNNLIAVRGSDLGGQRYVDLKVIIPSDVGQVVVPYLSNGYKYKIVAQNQGLGFQEPRFDDSSFNTGRAAFGSREGACSLNNPVEVRTRWDGNNDILLRKFFQLGPNAQKVSVSVAVDNAVQVFLNGVEITNGWINQSGCPRRNSIVISAPNSVLKNGSNLIAVRARNFEGLNYIDLQIKAENP
jgi:hypothetical protein